MKEKKNSRELLNRSCAWIRQHWDAKNSDVPDELLREWIYSPTDEADPTGFYLAVFSFGHMQHELVSRNVPPGARLSFSASVLLELFQMWQLKLALVEVHRITHLRISPLALFAFPENEAITVSDSQEAFESPTTIQIPK